MPGTVSHANATIYTHYSHVAIAIIHASLKLKPRLRASLFSVAFFAGGTKRMQTVGILLPALKEMCDHIHITRCLRVNVMPLPLILCAIHSS
jgi:hypothetical protein